MGNIMTKEIIYTLASGEKFKINSIIPKQSEKSPSFLVLRLLNTEQEDSEYIYISSPEEVDEFCELLQEKKKGIWK